MGCGASNEARPAPNTTARPAGSPTGSPTGSPAKDAAGEAAAAAEAVSAAASPSSGERTRWQAEAEQQAAARQAAQDKRVALAGSAESAVVTGALSKAELPLAEQKLARAEGWLQQLDERATAHEAACQAAADEHTQLVELQAGTRRRADLGDLLDFDVLLGRQFTHQIVDNWANFS